MFRHTTSGVAVAAAAAMAPAFRALASPLPSPLPPACDAVLAAHAHAAGASPLTSSSPPPSPPPPSAPLAAVSRFQAFLTKHAAALARGDFEGSNGSHARLVCGARPADVAAAVRAVGAGGAPGVLVVHVPGAECLRRTPLEAVAERVGVPLTSPLLPWDVSESLEASGTRVLLVVDGVEAVYRAAPPASGGSAEAWETALWALGDFSLLGNTTSGLFGVVLVWGEEACDGACARTAFGGHDAATRAAYPRSSGAPDLNATRYWLMQMA